MQYNNKLSNDERLSNQYNGFIRTISPLYWSDKHISLFPFPASDGFLENLSLSKNMVLGKRAEAFFSAMVLNSRAYYLKASQIQLINKGITEGEMDFLVEHLASKKLIHVELAYKFYLLDMKILNPMGKWVGPNRRDSLERKWIKLKDVQFPKLHSPTAIDFLRKLGFEQERIQQSLCMPMQLYIPFCKSKSSMGALSACYAGRWISFDDFSHQKWDTYTFFIPEKEDWFGNPEKCEVWLSQMEIMPILLEKIESRRSPLIWMKSKDCLTLRVFITFW